jgi:hypothetical protein
MAVIRPDFYLTTHLRHRAGLSHARIPVRVPTTKRPAVVLGTPAAGLGTNSRYDERRSLPMKVTGSSTGPRPEAAEHARAKAIRFFRARGFFAEEAEALAWVAAEVGILQPADSGDGAR